jgi:hypothetical protein
VVRFRRSDEPEIRIAPPRPWLDREVEDRLRQELVDCPDVAFAHLNDVEVVGEADGPVTSLFVWLVPEAVGSLRSALNLVSEAVARSLPEDRFLDVLILNSAPDLLGEIEAVGEPFVVRDHEERARALDAAALPDGDQPVG